MSAIREHALAEYLPARTVTRFPSPIDLKSSTNSPRVIIDFGCGMGDHTLALAKTQPAVHVLAMDVHTAGITQILTQATDSSLENISVYLGDGIEVLKDVLAPQSISEVHVLFPDPWPKARQQKRRLIQPKFLELVDQVLETQGVFRFVTDDDNYAQTAAQVIQNHRGWTNLEDDWQVPTTNYHRRALSLGHTIHAINAVKN